MINNVVHHFTSEQNFVLAKKIAAALKPGGVYAIGEFIRQSKPGEGGIVPSTTGLYFSLTSSSGTWSIDEMEAWQKSAGLKIESLYLRCHYPGWKILIARKIMTRVEQQNIFSPSLTLLSSGSGRRNTEYQHSRKSYKVVKSIQNFFLSLMSSSHVRSSSPLLPACRKSYHQNIC
jgi:hypothetical protein